MICFLNVISKPPPAVGGKRFRAYYAVQTGNRPYRIKIFCNTSMSLTESYRRYLESGVIEEFRLHGCPVHFDLTGKERAPRSASDPRRNEED